MDHLLVQAKLLKSSSPSMFFTLEQRPCSIFTKAPAVYLPKSLATVHWPWRTWSGFLPEPDLYSPPLYADFWECLPFACALAFENVEWIPPRPRCTTEFAGPLFTTEFAGPLFTTEFCHCILTFQSLSFVCHLPVQAAGIIGGQACKVS